MSKFSDDDLFEDIGSVTGTFVKWSDVGDKVEGTIVHFDLEGGTDFNGAVCPQLVLATSDGNVIVQGAQANLRRKMVDGAPKLKAGHLCRVTFSGTYESAKGVGKEFRIQVSPEPVLVDVTPDDEF
jgi:hypothetical protein